MMIVFTIMVISVSVSWALDL